MRRMMHAAACLLVTGSFAHAQTTHTSVPAMTVGVKSVLVASAATNNANEHSNPAPVNVATQAAPEFVSYGSERPFSQFTAYMNCNSCSSNLWNNYASERAMMAAQLMRHVDGSCGCFDGKKCLHAQVSAPCIDGGCRPLNRYKSIGPCTQSGGETCNAGCKLNLCKSKFTFSSLYDAPSIQCGPSCKVKAGCVNTTSSSSCTSGCSTGCGMEGSGAVYPSSAMQPNPPSDRVADPSTGYQRAEIQPLEMQYQASR